MSFLQYSTKSTVLIVGFNLGFVLVFNSHGDILASDPGPLEEPVRNILIQNESKHIEEVYVIYKTGVYILQCKHVFRIIEEKDFYSELRYVIRCVQFNFILFSF